MEGLVIRTLYSNKDWRDRCKGPWSDPMCGYCRDNKLRLDIRPPSPGADPCDGSCWEQELCKLYRWGCTPKGRRWGRRARPGMKVFFVFREVHSSGRRLYTLWGKTSVKSIGPFPGAGGYDFIYFCEFKPAPRDAWRSGLTDAEIVGKLFGQGNYRYVPNAINDKLDKMIPGA